MTITARCHPGLEALLPRPVPAASAFPDWLREMPSEAASDLLGGQSVRTLKQCPPVLDALSLGILIPLACDVRFADGEVSWDWDFPDLTGHGTTRGPIGIHLPDQASGAPFRPDGLILKFTNYWTLQVPDGWQVLFTHPLNRPDLPFRSFAGLVDADRFGHGHVHFPALWLDETWEGVLSRGTPVVQAIPVPRTAVALDAGPMSAEDLAATEAIQHQLNSGPGVYRRKFRLRAR